LAGVFWFGHCHRYRAPFNPASGQPGGSGNRGDLWFEVSWYLGNCAGWSSGIWDYAKSKGEEINEIALGFGDVNLACVIGLLLGWPGIIAGIFLAIILGGVVSGIFLLVQLLRKKYHAFQALPYGPFIVLSAILLIFLADLF